MGFARSFLDSLKRPIVNNSIIISLTASFAIISSVNAQVQLTNRTAEAGLSVVHSPHKDIIPSGMQWMTGGMAVGDFNNDGYQDLYWICGGGDPDRLFINHGNGTFAEQAVSWGIDELHGGCGAAVGDYDGDGWDDIFVSSFGTVDQAGEPGHNRLYHNNGNGTFTEVAQAAGVNYASQSAPGGFGAAFGDYDLDGDLDLMVTRWGDEISGDRLYQNNGDGTFTDVTDAALGPSIFGVWGFQPAFIDMNGDLYPELLIAGDFEASRYYVNNGDGTFTDQTVPSGTGLDDNGMGQTVADFNNDGLFDWYVTSIHQVNPPPGNNIGNMLYMNMGSNTFDEVSVQAGVNDGGWGWGTVAVDLDNNGFVDIVEVNGRAANEWLDERGKLFYNNGDGTFTEIAETAGFNQLDQGLALCYADTDNDGDQDIFAFTNAGSLLYYENDTVPSGAWLRITLDTSNNPLLAPRGFGTLAKVMVGKNTYIRYMNSAPSYLGTSEWAMHFGLGDAKVIDELRLVWSRGYETVLTDVPVNQQLLIQAPDLADLNADGVVSVADLLMLFARWGIVQDSSALVADLNNDGAVTTLDLLMLFADWG